ncbi:MAG: X-Pro dipeptidyl-peptidase family [Verrucomicrobiales bacterium]|nr:X-Pro dipeptidyl-peptidase family [Verrucomicrobiales bacterium]
MKCRAALLTLLVSALALAARSDEAKPRKTTRVKIEIPADGHHSFAAMLTLPGLKDRGPAIVLIPGFVPGAQSHGEETWRDLSTEDSATTLTRYLALNGFAVLQMPIGNFALGGEPPGSLDELADRAISAVQYLKTRPEIDSARIGIIGQSVGGFIGAIATSKSKDVVVFVTLATPMDSIDRTYDEVLEQLLRGGKAREAEQLKVRNKMKETFAAARKGADAKQLCPAVEDFLRSEYACLPKQYQELAATNADEFVRKQLEDHLRDLTTPLYRSMIGYDIGQTLKGIDRPMLILFAEHDFKVEPQRSTALATALMHQSGRTNWTVKTIAGANHFFEASAEGVLRCFRWS